MAEDYPSNPVPLSEALTSLEGESLATIAAFVLAAGVWHQRKFQDDNLIPLDQLEILGFRSWNCSDRDIGSQTKIDPTALEFVPTYDAGQNAPSPDYLREQGLTDERLAHVIRAAVKSGSKVDAAIVVAEALRHHNPLIQISALVSAIDILRIGRQRLMAIGDSIDYHMQTPGEETPIWRRELTTALLEVFENRPWNRAINTLAPPFDHSSKPPTTQSGLILIHGTCPWGRPNWSVPGTGPLFTYIKNRMRPDVYGAPDYYRWGGGHTYYAREEAARDLSSWVTSRELKGIDAVAHSHGGNVALEATQLGCAFGELLLLSCPFLRGKKYRLKRAAAERARSIRAKCDLVLLACRVWQLFPRGIGIAESILPIWFYGHGATVNPDTWSKHGITI
jgi:hypothetical protein